ncbi:MAG TPA: GspE/PulE family protein [Patescibacteria group bacterium]|nr:GspE/PulE family protein [Patescibacteria group bacterium]
MTPDEQAILNILVKESYITEVEAKEAAQKSQNKQIPLLEYFLTNRIIDKSLLGQAIAEGFQVPFTNLSLNKPSQEQIIKIPQDLALKYTIVLAKDAIDSVTIASGNPKLPGLLEGLRKIFPTQAITITYAFPKDIEDCFIHYRDPLIVRLGNILKSETSFAPDLFEEVLKEALIQRASDIHFEPRQAFAVIRFRIDGVLHRVGDLPKPLYDNILNRVKILAHLRIDEHTKPQDGAIRFTEKGMETDLRVSIVPTLDGEKISIRILSKYIESFSLENLGLTPKNKELLLLSAKKPFGMILVTGPTGSGKTTTLYALIKLLNRPEVNITTIEDPVEYKIDGANQIQVNPQTNLTFASGLKSIVRQDPNIILVGEIRDLETVEIAINAALTGHLLFSTFHANDAASAIPRLIDTGAEPYMLSSTLELIIAQRLVRKICDACRMSQTYQRDYLEQTFPALIKHFSDQSITLYMGKGCANCAGTGYKGRLAIFEFINISHKIRDLIIRHPSGNQVWEAAKSEGAVSLFEDGFEKVKAGITTLEELLRVTQPV